MNQLVEVDANYRVRSHSLSNYLKPHTNIGLDPATKYWLRSPYNTKVKVSIEPGAVEVLNVNSQND